MEKEDEDVLFAVLKSLFDQVNNVFGRKSRGPL